MASQFVVTGSIDEQSASKEKYYMFIQRSVVKSQWADINSGDIFEEQQGNMFLHLKM